MQVPSAELIRRAEQTCEHSLCVRSAQLVTCALEVTQDAMRGFEKVVAARAKRLRPRPSKLPRVAARAVCDTDLTSSRTLH